MSDYFDKEFEKEWRSLSFYYMFDVNNKCWNFYGSKNGLLNFCSLLLDYVDDPNNRMISEHEHYGPYSYLKIVTWNTAIIKKDGIYGTLQDLKNLEIIIRTKLLSGYSDILIDKNYSENNEAYIHLKVMDNDFDPANFASIRKSN